MRVHYNLPGRDFPDLVAEQVITNMHPCVVSSLFTLLCASLGASPGKATLVRMDTNSALPKRLARAAAFIELIAASKDVSTSNLLYQDNPFDLSLGPIVLCGGKPCCPASGGPNPLLLQTQHPTNRHNNTAFKEHLLLPGFDCPLLSSAGPTEMRAGPPDNYSCLWKVQALRSFPYKHEPNTTPLSCEACYDEFIGRLNSTVPMQQRCCNCDSDCYDSFTDCQASFTASENKTAMAQDHFPSGTDLGTAVRTKGKPGLLFQQTKVETLSELLAQNEFQVFQDSQIGSLSLTGDDLEPLLFCFRSR